MLSNNYLKACRLHLRQARGFRPLHSPISFFRSGVDQKLLASEDVSPYMVNVNGIDFRHAIRVRCDDKLK